MNKWNCKEPWTNSQIEKVNKHKLNPFDLDSAWMSHLTNRTNVCVNNWHHASSQRRPSKSLNFLGTFDCYFHSSFLTRIHIYSHLIDNHKIINIKVWPNHQMTSYFRCLWRQLAEWNVPKFGGYIPKMMDMIRHSIQRMCSFILIH